ncbi:MAG: PIG-L family deacetylase, partial [Anaerolineae bacterium]|nr:PIG-L family deacetylase [Anaerolineae bacterium]
MTKKLILMAIFAHPDDEAFSSGGTLTKYASEGIEIHLVTATLGQQGQLANPAVALTQPIGVLREQELRCACEAYGVAHLHLLGYMDGQTTIAPQSEAVFKIVRLLRTIKPQVVLSFGPDGSYGHYDHLAVHRWATAAVDLAPNPEHWPEAGPAHSVAKFYHRALPESTVQNMEERFGRSAVMMDGVPFPFFGYPDEAITTVIDIRDQPALSSSSSPTDLIEFNGGLYFTAFTDTGAKLLHRLESDGTLNTVQVNPDGSPS